MKSRVAIVSFLAVLGLVIGLVSPVAHAAQPPPHISSISPASGPPGTTVTLTGSGFAPIPVCYVRVDYVNLQGRADYSEYHSDTVTSDWNANRLVLRLDPRAKPGTTMTISITVYSDPPGDSNVVSFKVTPAPANPVIDSVTPNPCASGGRLTIKGKNFGETQPEDFSIDMWNASNPSDKYNVPIIDICISNAIIDTRRWCLLCESKGLHKYWNTADAEPSNCSTRADP